VVLAAGGVLEADVETLAHDGRADRRRRALRGVGDADDGVQALLRHTEIAW
jgi:hypothetical protein